MGKYARAFVSLPERSLGDHLCLLTSGAFLDPFHYILNRELFAKL
jgi:hypothetical protein